MKGSWRDRVRPWVPRPMLAAYRRLRRAGENGAATTDAGTVDFELPVAPLAQLFPGFAGGPFPGGRDLPHARHGAAAC